MPVARFQMPDGRIGRFEVPEGTSPEQAQVLIQQQVSGEQPSIPSSSTAYNPSTNYLPQGAKSFLEKVGIDFNSPMMQKYAEGYKQMPQMLQDPYLGLSTSNIGKITSEMFPNVAEQVTKKVSRTLPEWLMQSALKPSVKDLETGKAQKAIKTLLEENVNPTQGSTIFGKGLDTLQSKVNVLNDQIKNILSSSTGTVSKSDVSNYLNTLKTKASKQVNPAEDLAAINKVEQEFAKYNKPLIETPTQQIPVQLAQELKQGTYKSLGGKVYGELKSSDIEAQKALAKGLKEKIAQAEPTIAGLNEQESRLLNALNVSERRALIEANKDMLGLSSMSRDAKNQLLAMADRSAPVKALLARIIYNAQKIPSKVGGLLEQPMPNIPFSNIPITSDLNKVIVPNILKGINLLSQEEQ